MKFVDREQDFGLRRKDTQSCEGLIGIESHCSNNYSREAKRVGDDFKDYFCKEGILGWQW